MKWIVNLDLIDKMNESEFSIIQFPTDYFEESWGCINSPHHSADRCYSIDSKDACHICDFATGVKFFGNSYHGEKPYIEYGRTMQSGHSNLVNSDKYVTLVTFTENLLAELCSSHTINAYMLFVKEAAIDMRDTTNEEEKCYDVYIPDTRIRGLIRVKTEYSFDTDKLTLNHPYRIRFLQDIDVFDQHFKFHDEIYAILSRASDTSLRFATVGTVIHDNRIAVPFELTPDMKFELDKLV